MPLILTQELRHEHAEVLGVMSTCMKRFLLSPESQEHISNSTYLSFQISSLPFYQELLSVPFESSQLIVLSVAPIPVLICFFLLLHPLILEIYTNDKQSSQLQCTYDWQHIFYNLNDPLILIFRSWMISSTNVQLSTKTFLKTFLEFRRKLTQ